ncbi:MAG: DUF1800 domain-containing protein, partial [Pseudomonadota bacterium]|nr:DUF1800 domain-containing protein [Pseudomonadota bacterium]
SRFLAQASMGASRADIARVQAIGYAAWLDEQIAVQPSTTRWDALVAGGFADTTFKNGEAGFDACAWRKLLSSPDTLRQRVTLALSEIMVTSIDSLTGGGWKSFAAANYLDLLEANAFGNYRSLMQAVSTSTAMGMYLTFRGSMKANPMSGSLPDENYARELMQLFTIGLVILNLDGTPALTGGNPAYTYGQADITGLARVFTGYDFDVAGTSLATSPDALRRPMTQVASRHETGASTFLGATVPANSTAAAALTIALDTIFAHANVGPFVSKQLIQRLVTSNPSPAYVSRVATVFNNDGGGGKGNLAAVVKAILLDDEARSAGVAAGVSAGKLREPMLRFTAWARAWNASSPGNGWSIGNTSDAATRLGQSPLRSPSVFNFFRPGYVPPNSAIAAASLVAPEFQLNNESTVVGAVNYLQRAMSAQGVGDLAADYTALLAIADDAVALVAEINLVLAANQISAASATLISNAVATLPGGSDALRLKRIYASLTLVVAAPEFVVLK